MQKNNRKKLVSIGALYLGISMLIASQSNEDGLPNIWWICPISGPTWYLSLAVASIHRPFEYLDGIVRIKSEDVLRTIMFIGLWLAGISPLLVWSLSENRHVKTLSLAVFIVLWGTAVYINLFLLSLFAG